MPRTVANITKQNMREKKLMFKDLLFFLTIFCSLTSCSLPERETDLDQLRKDYIIEKSLSEGDYVGLVPPAHHYFQETWDISAAIRFLMPNGKKGYQYVSLRACQDSFVYDLTVTSTMQSIFDSYMICPLTEENAHVVYDIIDGGLIAIQLERESERGLVVTSLETVFSKEELSSYFIEI